MGQPSTSSASSASYRQDLVLLLVSRLVDQCRWELVLLLLCFCAQPLGSLLAITIDQQQANGTMTTTTTSDEDEEHMVGLFSSLVLMVALVSFVGRVAFRLYVDTKPDDVIPRQRHPHAAYKAQPPQQQQPQHQQQQQDNDNNDDLESRLTGLLGRVDRLHQQVATAPCWGSAAG